MRLAKLSVEGSLFGCVKNPPRAAWKKLGDF